MHVVVTIRGMLHMLLLLNSMNTLPWITIFFRIESAALSLRFCVLIRNLSDRANQIERNMSSFVDFLFTFGPVIIGHVVVPPLSVRYLNIYSYFLNPTN